MITTQNYLSNYINKKIDIHKSIVLLGAAHTNYKRAEVEMHSSLSIVESLYGNSKLTSCFKDIQKVGIKSVFLVNVKTSSDYIKAIQTLKHYNFSYIIPIDIMFSDSFYNSNEKKQQYYLEYFIEELSSNNNSLIIMTDMHASLYENTDSYLLDMNQKIKTFKRENKSSLRLGRNFCFVCNMLESYSNSNVILGAVLAYTDTGKYPLFDFGNSVFDISEVDVFENEMIYFQNNYLTETTVENLNNFRTEYDCLKNININNVIRYIDNQLDFSQYKGKLFSEFIKNNIYKEIDNFLNKIKGSAIRDFKINEIFFIKTNIGSGIIICDFVIVPINSIEEYNILLEV